MVTLLPFFTPFSRLAWCFKEKQESINPTKGLQELCLSQPFYLPIGQIKSHDQAQASVWGEYCNSTNTEKHEKLDRCIATSSLNTQQKGVQVSTKRHTHLSPFTTTLFIIASSRKQPKYPSMVIQIFYICMMEYYTAVTMNEPKQHADR
jgi:hypothetical protein